MARSVEVLPGTTEVSGHTIKVTPIVHPDLEVKASSTARHEAIHAVAAVCTGTEVVEVTVIPGSNYSGRVALAEFNAVAAIAPFAFGCSGTGFDRWLVIRQRHDPNLLAAVARSVLAGKEKELAAVASLVQAKGTISGQEVKWAIKEINKPKASVEITNLLGEKRHFVEKLTSPSLKIALSLN